MIDDFENPFKASDFKSWRDLSQMHLPGSSVSMELAALANARFREIMAECPTVFGQKEDCDDPESWTWTAEQYPLDDHSAKLFGIKKL